MCGICGIVSFPKDNPPSAETLKRMNEVLVLRGPDDEGMYLDKRVGLAVRRLSIIDLKTGHQPIHNEDSSVWLVLNGEIYNYRELRTELKNKGHRFYTDSDSEVIIHAYEQYGEDSLKELRGMFAFALWDEERQIFILARDRFGIKPLYYSVLSDKIIFASETKSILQSGECKTELNSASIDNFFSFSYVPGTQTIFKNIQKLSPGHVLILKDNDFRIKEYWQLDYSKSSRLSQKECQHRLSELLEESVKLHLRSDVPVGIFLSGGIDSSAITYLVNRQGVKPLRTFSIGFDDERNNELGYARLVANYFKTEHYEEMLTDKTIDSLPDIIKQLSEPLADFSIVPTYFVSKLAQKKVKVVLCGEGGDELFAGYSWHRVSGLAKFYQALPIGIRKYLTNTVKGIGTNSLNEKSSFYRRIRYFLMYSALPLSGRYLWRIAYFNQEQRQKLFSDDFKDLLKNIKQEDSNYPFGEEQEFKDFLTAMLYFDMKFFLPGDLLLKMDQMTMAHSLEGRIPFLDHKLVEFVASLPSTMKLHNGVSKYLLKKVISGKVPKEILTKPKQGFMPPVQKWVNKRFDDFFIPILNDKKTKGRGYFNQSFIEQMVNQHRKGQVDYSYQLWMLVAFELWLRVHLN